MRTSRKRAAGACAQELPHHALPAPCMLCWPDQYVAAPHPPCPHPPNVDQYLDAWVVVDDEGKPGAPGAAQPSSGGMQKRVRVCLFVAASTLLAFQAAGPEAATHQHVPRFCKSQVTA